LAVTSASRVRLHPLSMTDEGNGSWIVGRVETGDFAQIPDEGVTALMALGEGCPVAEAGARVRAEHGADVDAIAFVTDMLDLGFVSRIDGQDAAVPDKPPSLPWLTSRHVRWAFQPWARACVAAFVLAGLTSAAVRGDLLPSYRAFFITSSPGADLAVNMTIFTLAVASHEFWHLAAARSAGVHARFGLGTRLYMLVAQTTVSGLWGVPTHVRRRVYLAGMASDLTILSGCYLAMSALSRSGLAYRTMAALALGLVLGIAYQFEVFMRTDLYFVLQDLARCKNLYADAVQFLRFSLRVKLAWVSGWPAPPDPTAELPAHERRPVRIYSRFMVLGSVLALALFALYQGPIIVALAVGSARRIAAGWASADPVKLADGLCVLGIEAVADLLFLKLFATKHLPKLRALVRVIRQRLSGRWVAARTFAGSDPPWENRVR
jgi:putative peptide zinc metalloprotease protein